MSKPESGKTTDELGGKYELEDASVYIHIPSDSDSATVPHIDVCAPEVGHILSGEDTFFGSMPSGGFIGLKEEMIPRARQLAALHETGQVAQNPNEANHTEDDENTNTNDDN
jgi:hypothetical protein